MKLVRTALVVCACMAIVAACSGPPQVPDDVHEDDQGPGEQLSLSAEAYEVAAIKVATVGMRALVPTVQVTGTLSYDERHMAIATARIGGRITRVVADYGQTVAAGDALAWIDSPELGAAQADYRRAATTSKLHRTEFERAELLLEGQAISRGELLRRKADWMAAEAELKTAEQKLHILGLSLRDVEALAADRVGTGHEYPVRAPINGRVTERQAVPGRVVSPDDELFTVANLESLWLFLQVFEKDLPSVHKSATVMLTCESHPEERFRGTIDFVGEVLDPHSRTVSARAVIDNPRGELKPGMFVYVSIETRQDEGLAASRLAVPKTAVAGMDGRDVVFVQTAERTFGVRPVVTGESTGDWIEIRSGLSEGETIAVDGVFILKSEALKGGLEEHHH